MSVDGDFYRFIHGELLPVSATHSENLSVADSFLISDHMVRRLDLHEARFAREIPKARVTTEEISEFFTLARRALPRVGNWFPRLEFREDCAGTGLFLRIRPAPALTQSLTLWTHPEPDPRSKPTVKGPDLSLCQQLRRAANLHGADEAVIVDASGYIADGALSSIVWWQDEVLCAPDASTNWLPSITRHLTLELANQAGYEIRLTKAKPTDLAGCEVWSLSALQGIRVASAWGEVPLAQPRHHQSFRKRLSLLASEI